MQLFTSHDILNAGWISASAAWEMKGLIAEHALKLVFLPLYELSFSSCLVSLGWIYFFWLNKSWIFSGLSSAVRATDWMLGLLNRA